MTEARAEVAEAVAVAIEAAPAEEKPKTPEEKAAILDAVRAAKTDYAAATTRIQKLREALAAAQVKEAQALEVLKAARLGLKKEAEGE